VIAAKHGYQKLVKQHYKKEAKAHGLAPTATMLDERTRHAEIEAILPLLKAGQDCLEVGCGNGAASVEFARNRKINLTCVDFSPDLIALAKKQSLKGLKGTVSFHEQDILQLTDRTKYDVVFTERCIINLLNWDDQKEALRRMARALKKGGKLSLIEAFKDGLWEMNRARAEVGLSDIKPAYHNLHLDKDEVGNFLGTQGMSLVSENNFLSTYYFGSRVLYPALAQLAKKDVTYNSAFGNFFAQLPNAGNYSHIKQLVFAKK
jgi:ubiquinone/menaquinone biosynthesis C-methylase UbiE